jgi:hypothetical protein
MSLVAIDLIDETWFATDQDAPYAQVMNRQRCSFFSTFVPRIVDVSNRPDPQHHLTRTAPSLPIPSE